MTEAVEAIMFIGVAIFAIWLFVTIVLAIVAHAERKGRWCWIAASVFFTPWILIFLFLSPPLNKR